MSKKPIINEGVIIGSEENPFNANSYDFLEVRETIIKASMAQSNNEKLENIILSLRFKVESYLENKAHINSNKHSNT